MMQKLIKLSIVVPAYNEEEMLGISIPKLIQSLEDLIYNEYCTNDSFIVIVDDGSSDTTWEIITSAVLKYPNRIRGISLACNVGHQAALLAGLDYVTEICDVSVSIDADLQDDLGAIQIMLDKFRNGSQIVLGVRNARDVDSWFKRVSASSFYKFMNIMGINIVFNHADFRLLSSTALNNLRQFTERNLFLRGLQPLLHKKIAIVEYRRFERQAGSTKYSLTKMLSLAWNGVTSFSIAPLRLISATGGVIFLISTILAIYAVSSVFFGKTVPGWASIVVPLYLLGGMLMLSIGIVGEYVGKIFMETKRRPRAMIDTIIGEPLINHKGLHNDSK